MAAEMRSLLDGVPGTLPTATQSLVALLLRYCCALLLRYCCAEARYLPLHSLLLRYCCSLLLRYCCALPGCLPEYHTDHTEGRNTTPCVICCLLQFNTPCFLSPAQTGPRPTFPPPSCRMPSGVAVEFVSLKPHVTILKTSKLPPGAQKRFRNGIDKSLWARHKVS